MTADQINGCFEFAGGTFLFWNVYCLFRDKTLKGASVLTAAFFTTRAIWDLFYYPQLHQWFSFAGDVFTVAGDLAWIILALTYRRKHKLETISSRLPQ